jgi:hypothetical protein
MIGRSSQAVRDVLRSGAKAAGSNGMYGLQWYLMTLIQTQAHGCQVVISLSASSRPV